MSQPIDIGHGFSYELKYYPPGSPPDLEGKLGGADYWHPCRGGIVIRDWIPLDDGQRGWKVEQLEPLTLSPSLLCTVCKFHGFIREGRWVPA